MQDETRHKVWTKSDALLLDSKSEATHTAENELKKKEIEIMGLKRTVGKCYHIWFASTSTSHSY